jgi:DNA-directed RNA polymerase subunit beta'
MHVSEAAVLLTPACNWADPQSGELLLVPSGDIVLGCAYLTADPALGEPRPSVPLPCFCSPAEVERAYAAGKIALHSHINVRLGPHKRLRREVLSEETHLREEEIPSGYSRGQSSVVATTVGRVLFNAVLDSRLPYYDCGISRSRLRSILDDCHRQLGQRPALEMLERVQALALTTLTLSGLSVGMDDLRCRAKREIVAQAELEIEKIDRQQAQGVFTAYECLTKKWDRWSWARDEITKALLLEWGHVAHAQQRGSGQRWHTAMP